MLAEKKLLLKLGEIVGKDYKRKLLKPIESMRKLISFTKRG